MQRLPVIKRKVLGKQLYVADLIPIIIPVTIIIAIAGYAATLFCVVRNNYMVAKSFIQVALFGNFLNLVLMSLLQSRLPVGGLLETCSEAALVLGLAYAVVLRYEHRRLAMVVIAACIALMLLSLARGVNMHPYNYVMASMWYQLTCQLRLLLNGVLLFCLLCLGTLIFSKAEPYADDIRRFARTGVILSIVIYLLWLLVQMQWCFSAVGDGLQWDSRLMLALAMPVFLALALVSQTGWFKQPKAVIKFDALLILAVLAANVMEWGGLV